jgi:hypothetical protein
VSGSKKGVRVREGLNITEMERGKIEQNRHNKAHGNTSEWGVIAAV